MTLTETMMASLARHHASNEDRCQTLWRMTQARREAAMWRGELTTAQLYEWVKAQALGGPARKRRVRVPRASYPRGRRAGAV